MKINEFFENEFLRVGCTYDNFIFENCPNYFLSLAKEKLSVINNNTKPVNIVINRELEERFEKTIINFNNDFHKKILARDFICALIMKKIFDYTNEYCEEKNNVNNQINAFLNNDFNKVKEMHSTSFMPFDVKKKSK